MVADGRLSPVLQLQVPCSYSVKRGNEIGGGGFGKEEISGGSKGVANEERPQKAL